LKYSEFQFGRFFLLSLLFFILTILTQIGGLVLVIGLILANFFDFKFKKPVLVITCYLIFTFLIVPYVAPVFGRERVRNSKEVKATTFITILLNRNYVKPELNELIHNTASDLPQGIEVRYLDANFPFWDGFPLLPHLSHNDGKKIDLSFVYQNEKGEWVNAKPSRTGYGVFVEPKTGEYNQTKYCFEHGYWQYDYAKYFSFGRVNEHLEFSNSGTKTLLNSILLQSDLGKIFLEKHLKERMGFTDERFRFQGCGSVRHDDHIHIQLK